MLEHECKLHLFCFLRVLFIQELSFFFFWKDVSFSWDWLCFQVCFEQWSRTVLLLNRKKIKYFIASDFEFLSLFSVDACPFFFWKEKKVTEEANCGKWICKWKTISGRKGNHLWALQHTAYIRDVLVFKRKTSVILQSERFKTFCAWVSQSDETGKTLSHIAILTFS